MLNGKKIELGSYETREEADAVLAAFRLRHGLRGRTTPVLDQAVTIIGEDGLRALNDVGLTVMRRRHK